MKHQILTLASRLVSCFSSFASGLAVLLLVANAAEAQQKTYLVPNGTGDDTAALTNTLSVVHSGDTVKFLAGTYDFYSSSTPVGFSLSGKDNIVIKGTTTGGGTTLQFHNFNPNVAPGSPGSYPFQIFSFNGIKGANGITVRDLNIVMVREPYSSGTVSGRAPAGQHWIDLTMEQNYSDLSNGFLIDRMDNFDPINRRLKASIFAGASYDPVHPQYNIENRGTNPLKFRIWATSYSPAGFVYFLDHVPLNDGVILMHAKYGCHFMLMVDCEHVLVQNVNLRDMSGMGLVAYRTSDITIDNFDFVPKSDRLLSATADGIHLQDCTGTLIVQNCNMSRMGDDGLNVHSKYLQVSSIPGGGSGTVGLQQLAFTTYWLPDWKPGDNIDFYAPNLAKRDSSQAPVLTAFTASPLQATFASGIPPLLAVGDLVADSSRAPSSILVDHCDIEDNIARGLTLHGSNITVNACTFRRNTGAAIALESEVNYFAEASPCQNATIQNCTIDDVNRYTSIWIGAVTVLGAHPSNAGGPPPNCSDSAADPTIAAHGLHKDITIANNVFSNLGNATMNADKRAAIWVTSTDSVHYNSNTVNTIQFSNPDDNVLRSEKVVNATSDGNNCVDPLFPTNRWFTVICTQFVPISPTCSW